MPPSGAGQAASIAQGHLDPSAILAAVRLGWVPDALTTQFSAGEFGDIFYPITAAAGILLIIAVVLYNVQTRRLHRHPPLVALQEWLLWTAICGFGLLLICAIFHFYLIVVLGTIVVTCVTFVWIRFFHFPPLIAAYNNQLRRARFYSQQRYKHPEATVRQRKSPTRRRRR
jgi:hypothetical protein